MATTPPAIAEFLAGHTIAVAGVSRTGQSAGNNVFQVLRKAGYDAVPVNPNATRIEGADCFPNLAAIGRPLDGETATRLFEQATRRSVENPRPVWMEFHALDFAKRAPVGAGGQSLAGA